MALPFSTPPLPIPFTGGGVASQQPLVTNLPRAQASLTRKYSDENFRTYLGSLPASIRNSLIDFATSVANFEYEKPLPIMKQMLQSRHLAPLYGERTPVAGRVGVMMVAVSMAVTMIMAVRMIVTVIVTVMVAHASLPAAGSAMCSSISVSMSLMWASAAE